jgi:hypothetical protein
LSGDKRCYIGRVRHFLFCHGPRKRAIQLEATRSQKQRLGGPVSAVASPGHDKFFDSIHSKTL